MLRRALLLILLLAVACSQDDPAEPTGTTTGDEPVEDVAPVDDIQVIEDVPEVVPEAKPITVDAPMSWVSDPTRLPFAVHMTWQRDPSSTVSFSGLARPSSAISQLSGQTAAQTPQPMQSSRV